MRTFLVLALLAWGTSSAGGFECNVGARFQKTWELYYENGLEAGCSHPSVLGGHVFSSASIVSSRLGSALGSNALRQEEYLLGLGWKFRLQNRIQPFVSLNAGWFWLDLEDPIFADLPHSSVLAAFSFGSAVRVHGPFLVRLGLGYHLITGDGLTGPGSLYPLFFHTSLLVEIP